MTGRIKELDLSKNKIGFQNFEMLLSIFTWNKQIELLNIDNCGLEPKTVHSLLSILQQNKHIKYLYLTNNNVGKIGGEAVAKLILESKTIIELDLYNCQLDKDVTKLLSSSLKKNFCIEKMSVGQNGMEAKELDLI